MEGIPTLDASSDDFKDQLEFNLWSTHSNSDYRNDRDRPYNGQPWTCDGVRGSVEVKGVTFRDIKDCFIKALLVSCASDKYLQPDEYMKCWDFSECKNDDDRPKPTQYLLDRQNDPDYISTKVELGTWRPQDVYKINMDQVDLIAVSQNLSVEIEKMMGIYPNIKINEKTTTT